PDALLTADWEARASAFNGRVGAAHDLFRRAAQDAARGDMPEIAAQWSAADVEVHAVVGQCGRARAEAGAALSLSRDNFTLERAGRALALCGATADAATLSTELANRFPEATLTRRIQLPVIAAALAVQRGDAAGAVAPLEG